MSLQSGKYITDQLLSSKIGQETTNKLSEYLHNGVSSIMNGDNKIGGRTKSCGRFRKSKSIKAKSRKSKSRKSKSRKSKSRKTHSKSRN
jgi:hypothetical protein